MKKRKYKNKYEFAEKLINELPFLKNCNVKVELNEFSKSYKPINSDSFTFGNYDISKSVLDYIGGLIDGAIYAYEKLEKEKLIKEIK